MRVKPRASAILLAILAVLILCAATRPDSGPDQIPSDLAGQIQRVENGIPPIPISDSAPALRLSLEQLMQTYKVPGLSIAVIDNFKIA
jgi:hypothetical protein